jgi:hypothetical protein
LSTEKPLWDANRRGYYFGNARALAKKGKIFTHREDEAFVPEKSNLIRLVRSVQDGNSASVWLEPGWYKLAVTGGGGRSNVFYEFWNVF